MVEPRLEWSLQESGTEKNQLKCPSDVGFVLDGTDRVAVAEYGNKRVQIFSSSGKSLRVIAEGTKPNGLAIHPDGQWLALTCDQAKTVKMFRLDGDDMEDDHVVWPSNIFHKPSGIGRFEDGGFVVSDPESDNNKINVMTAEGRLVKSFGTIKTGDQSLDSPNYVCVDSHDRIVVADWGNQAVKVFTREGERLARFGGYGDKAGQMKYPTGLAVDGEDNILVVDSGNYRISLYSPGGKFLQHVITKRHKIENFMQGTAFHDTDGLLAMTETGLETDGVRIYKINA